MALIAGIEEQIASRLKAVVGAAGYRDEPTDLEPFLTEWRGLYRGTTPLMLSPANVTEACDIIRICHAEEIGVVPQGGNTGLAGGAIPGITNGNAQILLSATRLNRIREVDVANYTMTVEAGCVLADLQEAASALDLLFPLSLAAEGSCQIGGNISTNAGGTNVLRYGNTRDLVLGLEAVLPNGELFDGLRGLRKDNTGYDLKQLFIGAEGTLGFITAATLKLFPAPASTATAWLAVAGVEAAVQLYGEARKRVGDELVGFELVPRIAVDMVLEHIPGNRDPLSNSGGWYVLLELASARDQRVIDDQLTIFLAAGMEEGLVIDGIVASSGAQQEELWRIRHSISEAQKKAGASIKHDISVPVSRIPEFLQAADVRVREALPGVRPVAFGHLGDGNLHYNLSQPVDMSADAFNAQWEAMNRIVHTLAVELGGSFSAEHGIGMLKTAELERLTSPVELDLMRTVKAAIDPHGIMNPGKVLREH